jgi:hypothetical protein
MTELRHKTFVGPTIYWQGGTLNQNREAIRAEAQEFVNRIGFANVMSICEHDMSFGPFSVVVWYRESAMVLADDAVVQVKNSVIARRLHNEPPPLPPTEIPWEPGQAPASTWLGWVFAALIALAAMAILLIQQS